MREERFIIKVVEMYYRQGMSQVEIGKKLNVSRTTVSRALSQARDQGFVQIKINYPEGALTGTESRLEERYGLKEAVVASEREGADLADEVAFYAADYILRVLHNHMILAVTRGRALKKTVDMLSKDVRLRFLKTDDIKVVPLMATTNMPESADKEFRLAYSNYLVEELAGLLGGHSYQLLAPQYVDSKEIKESFLRESSVREVLSMVKAADAAVMGIGPVDENSAMVQAKLIDPEEFEKLRAQGARGEVLSHMVDSEGRLIEGWFEDRLISLELEDLKKIPVRVGVASGMEKKEAIRAVLNGGIINVLITDEHVAEYLLE